MIDVVDVSTEDARWRQWKAKGRARETRFRRKVRTVVQVAGIIAAGGALWWFAFLK